MTYSIAGAHWCYSAYGLSVYSEMMLPELAEGVAASHGEMPITIRLGEVQPSRQAQASMVGNYCWEGDNTFYLDISQVARFLVSEGRDILVDRFAGAEEDTVRLFLLGSAFGALLYQRGLLVLHGNAVKVGQACLICVGRSGVGKSTLAAAFMQQGYDLLADDVIPVRASGEAIPGFPRIKLWEDAALKLEIDTADLRRVSPGIEKFNLPVFARFVREPLPIRWIYSLETHDSADLVIETISGVERYSELLANTYRSEFLVGGQMKKDHLLSCGELVGKIHMARILRPSDGYPLEALVARILENTRENGSSGFPAC
jgi:hypothetical protein